MAIIRPSLKFEGSELNLTASSAPYIKDSVRRAVFNKTTNQEGAYLYFLPAYKADHEGNGIWYKKVSIRDNFGSNFKEKYYVPNRSSDPAEYFANNFRILYPEDAKVTDQDVNGRKFKKYPNYGRVTDRIVYNVAFAQNLGAGAHVLDLPLRNGADNLMNWLDGRDISGRARQPVNDPDRCVPVFVKLKDGTANPWTIQVENNQPVQLPEQLADSDYLYNLDDIFISKSKEEIIAKLREMYSADVFDDCMNGYPGLTKTNTVRVAALEDDDEDDEIPRARTVQAPAAVVPAPVILNIPKATTTPAPVAVAAPVAAPVAVAAVSVPPSTINMAALPPNPMAVGRMSKEEAMRFINEN